MGKKTRIKLEKEEAIYKAQMKVLKEKIPPKKQARKAAPISLPAVCGRYPQKRSLAAFKCSSYAAAKRSAQLLKYLYCEYAVPGWLLDWLISEDSAALASPAHERSTAMLMALLYEMGNGRSPRPILKPYLSKAEMAVFFKSGKSVNPQNSIFTHFIYCKALARRLPEPVCGKIAQSVSEQRLDKQKIFAFAQSFVDFCAAREVNALSVQDIWDYLRCNGLIGNFSFKGRTLASMLNLVNAWHDALNREIRILQAKGRDDDWHAMQARINDLKVEYKAAAGIAGIWNAVDPQSGVPIEIRQLRKYTELINEGRAMHNCVASYHQRCAQNFSCIFSLSIDGGRKATIEVCGRKVIQARGNCNRRLEGAPLAWVKKWMSKFKLESSL